MDREEFTNRDDDTTTLHGGGYNGHNGSGGHDESSPRSGSKVSSDVPGRDNRRRGVSVFPLLLASLILGLLGGVGGYLLGPDVKQVLGIDESQTRFPQPANPPRSQSSGDSSDSGSNDSDDALTVNEIYKTAAPGVVHVSATQSVSGNSIFGTPREREGEATGSGFVIDEEGHIVTNAHVVEDSTEVSVSFNDDSKFDAEIVGQDVSSDIAVLKVKGTDEEIKRALKPLAFGDSKEVEVGDPVVAIGNPFSLDRTVTTGIISALQREIPAKNGFRITDVIQTDAAINPGNSGGPLLDLEGNVIGVNSQIQTESGGNVGIGFAAPSNTVKSVATQLIENGTVEHAYLGVTGGDVTAELQEVAKLPVDEGVLLFEVVPDSPADDAGLRGGDPSRTLTIDGEPYRLGGDVITKYDGTKVTTMREIVELVSEAKPGDEIEIEYFRDDDKKTTKVELVDRPEDTQQQREDEESNR